MQPQAAGASQERKSTSAPPAYRPHPVPKVLQTKRANGNPNPLQPVSRASAPHVASTRLQTSIQPARAASTAHSSSIIRRISRDVVVPARPVIQRAAAQPFRSGIVQATKFYPNLHPGAAVPVDRSNIFTLDKFAEQYRLHRIHSHSVNVPNMKYNFVRTREGQTLLHNRYRHPSLAEGQQVLYAGEVFFNNGRLQWWSNGSGHYQPDADGAEQANLPMDYFYSYQQIIKGEHTRRKG
ncbi:MAG TPA: hypothetical protein VF735_17940 [Pyrinomonadaceae bacterium]